MGHFGQVEFNRKEYFVLKSIKTSIYSSVETLNGEMLKKMSQKSIRKPSKLLKKGSSNGYVVKIQGCRF